MSRAFNPADMKAASSSDGRLSRIERRIEKLEKFLANLIGGEGISILPNAKGGATVRKEGSDIGGGSYPGASGAFSIVATEVLNPLGQSYDPKKYNVSIRGGTAQALGQAPHNFENATFEEVSAPRFFYVSYNIGTTYAWVEGIQSSETMPATDDPYPIVIGALDANGARQDRIGAIEVVVNDNSVDA